MPTANGATISPRLRVPGSGRNPVLYNPYTSTLTPRGERELKRFWDRIATKKKINHYCKGMQDADRQDAHQQIWLALRDATINYGQQQLQGRVSGTLWAYLNGKLIRNRVAGKWKK